MTAAILYSRFKVSAIACMLAMLMFTSACTLRLVSTYDERTDNLITNIQGEMDVFLNGLERTAGTEEAEYKNHVVFYDKVKADISTLRSRAAAIPKNDITVQQVDLLQQSVLTLEKLHQTKISAEQVKPIRDAFDVSCGAIIKWELEKKRQ